MTKLYHVSLSGPENGKPQRGSVAWMEFLHRDEERAHQLARILSERIGRRTGFAIESTVRELDLVEVGERSLLAAADALAAAYGEGEPAPRLIVEGEILCLNEAAWSGTQLDPSGLADRMLHRLRDEFGSEPSDWIILDQELADSDQAAEYRRGLVTLSLPQEQAQILMANAGAVAACSLRLVAGDGQSSLYDDDARMEEISADAEDAALHAWGPLGAPRQRANPHPDGSEEAEFWESSFLNAYARENGK